ncbi:MAG TPA: hypothetical protein VG993_05395 [Actinomycetota bacterium]|jgi:hypothetical protein|nr:hypothetical protein [Actinomycetota bacterium]
MPHVRRTITPPHVRRSKRVVTAVTASLTIALLGGQLTAPAAATAERSASTKAPLRGEGSGGDSASGEVPPGGLLTTRDGPINAADPFAIGLRNIGDETLDATIEEEPCDGSQEDALCSTPRVGGVAGDFIFQPLDDESPERSSTRPVAVAKLFYDRSVLEGVEGFRIFYQKDFSSPVIRLPRCDDGKRTECFQTKRRSNGDQIVKVRLSDDPRVTRG